MADKDKEAQEASNTTTGLDRPDLENMEERDIKEYEGDILNAILGMASFKHDESEFRRIKIVRNKTVMLQFMIRPMTDEDFSKCRKKNAKMKKGRFGVEREVLDTVRYHSQVIYEATVPDEKLGGVKVWDYKRETLWRQLNVASGVDAIDAILKAGEKDMIIDQIEMISGFRADEAADDIKN